MPLWHEWFLCLGPCCLIMLCTVDYTRFKHHCMAYRGPTVTLLRIEKDELLVVAVDVEWR